MSEHPRHDNFKVGDFCLQCSNTSDIKCIGGDSGLLDENFCMYDYNIFRCNLCGYTFEKRWYE